MHYDLIALDLDDTLLDKQKNISSRNRQAVAAAHAAGAHIVIATGRAYGALLQFARDLGIEDYSIIIGGALVADPKGSIVYGNYIEPPQAHAVMQWAADHGVHFQTYTDSGFVYLQHNQYTDNYEKTVGFKGSADPDLLDRTDMRAAKILFIDSPENIQTFKHDIADLFPGLTAQTSEPWFLEIMNETASKGQALKWLGELLHVPRRRIAAFGDSEIDVSMIEYAGLGVAVANACPQALAAADVVAPSCDENAVAWGIEKYVLE